MLNEEIADSLSAIRDALYALRIASHEHLRPQYIQALADEIETAVDSIGEINNQNK